MRCHDPRTDDRPFAQPGWYSAPRSPAPSRRRDRRTYARRTDRGAWLRRGDDDGARLRTTLRERLGGELADRTLRHTRLGRTAAATAAVQMPPRGSCASTDVRQSTARVGAGPASLPHTGNALDERVRRTVSRV